MKKIVILLMVLFLSVPLFSQNDTTLQNAWPKKSNGISLHASTIMFGFSPVNLSYDRLYHTRKLHYGFTTGLTCTLYDGADYSSLGAHLTFTLINGMNNHHFESKFGLTYNFLILWTRGWEDYALPIIPVVSLGYRYQKPDGKYFFRCGLSTGGIGVGFGKVF